MALSPEQVKKDFRARGITFKAWADEHGYRPQEVTRVLNGFSKATRGRGYEIAVKLGLKEQPHGK
ncbi:TPA: DNA-binding protein [Neisseria gonorrhoeae]|jgi:putative phage-related DNA-binding protein|nr:MAG TPA: hypothetical protein [Caudoviricetes sp.]